MNAVVPPTTHSLPKPQRLRLMRSTRKLTALLGATPLLVDSEEHLRTFESPLEPDPHEYPATIMSILSSAERDPADGGPAALVSVLLPQSTQQPTLLLRINTVPTRANRGRTNSQGWGRPASLTGFLPLPMSPGDDDDEVHAVLAARRNKMARVTRILGENVPPELVFPPVAPPRRTPRTDRESECESDSETPVEEIKSRLSIEEVRFAKIELAPLHAAVPPPSAYTSGSESSLPHQSASSDRGWLPQSIRRSTSQKRHNGRSTPVVMRTETGWIGEWNQEESTVVKTLRELKQK
ncbi:hypothetical protein B0H12DRAFT_1242373 [Mycena haematopus]|nr:hypothetical protein B0H12DRAFT_1242373 [Mycena haematopus]